MGAAVRAALDHAGGPGPRRPPLRGLGRGTRPVRHRGGPAGRHRPARPGRPHARGQPAVGPARFPGRGGGKPGAAGGRAARGEREPPALLRGDGRLGPGLRRGHPGPGGGRGVGDAPRSGRPHLGRAAPGAARRHPRPVRRPLPRQRGRALGRRRGRRWGAADRRHDLRHAGRGPDHLRVERAEPAAVARGRGPRDRPSGSAPSRSTGSTAAGPRPSARTRAGCWKTRPAGTSSSSAARRRAERLRACGRPQPPPAGPGYRPRFAPRPGDGGGRSRPPRRRSRPRWRRSRR